MRRNAGAAMPAASTPAPLMIRRRDSVEFPCAFFMVPPLIAEQYFLVSAHAHIRVSFCEHWSNGVGCGGAAAGGPFGQSTQFPRSEERRVGKECRSRGS